MVFNVELHTSVNAVSLPNKPHLCCMLQCIKLIDNVLIVVMKSFTIFLPAQYYKGDQLKGDDMVKCCTYVRKQKCIHCFRLINIRKRQLGRPRRR
jgi:hypothetical protein